MSGRSQAKQPTPFHEGLTPAEQAEISDATSQLGERAAALVAHTLLSERRHPTSTDGWVPLPATFLRKYFRAIVVNDLVALGVIEMDGHFVKGKRSRRYRISPTLSERLARAAVASATASGGVRDRDTGRTVRPLRTCRRDANEKLYPDPVLPGVDRIERGVFDRDSVDAYLSRAMAQADSLSSADGRARAFRRLAADTASYAAILRQRPRQVAQGIWEYVPAYTVQKTGRITERGGGLQSASRPLRAAAFASTGALDYDLAGSHPSITASMMEDQEMETAWLRRWVGDRPWRDTLATEVGLHLDVLKAGVMALVSGAPFPSLEQVANPSVQSTLVSAIREAVIRPLPGDVRYRDVESLVDVHDRARQVLGPLTDELRPWMAHVRRSFLTPGGSGIENHGRRVFVRNACGMRYYPWDDARAGRNRLPSLLAHLLQGAEAAVIHRLTASSREHGFEVVQNLHDGLVTLGTIPEEAVVSAVAATGLHGLRLVVKPFES